MSHSIAAIQEYAVETITTVKITLYQAVADLIVRVLTAPNGVATRVGRLETVVILVIVIAMHAEVHGLVFLVFSAGAVVEAAQTTRIAATLTVVIMVNHIVRTVTELGSARMLVMIQKPTVTHRSLCVKSGATEHGPHTPAT